MEEVDKLFVAPKACQDHISLLHTFHALRWADPDVEKVFLARAERRYLLWMDHVQETRPSPEILPPIGKMQDCV